MPIDETYEKIMGIFLADIEEAERMVPMNPKPVQPPVQKQLVPMHENPVVMDAIKTFTSRYLDRKPLPRPKEKQKVTIEEIGNTL